MSFIQKADKYSENMAESVKRGFFDDDIFTTMRFSHLYPDEQYSETMAFGNGRLWLSTGITQWEGMVDTLKKWKDWKIDKTKAFPEKLDEDADFNLEEVDDIIERWDGCKQDCKKAHKHIIGYNPLMAPASAENLVWVLNHGWRYNRSLMYYIGFFEPVQRAHLNTRYAVDSRTFNALVELGKAERGREVSTEIAGKEDKKKSWTSKLNPFK